MVPSVQGLVACPVAEVEVELEPTEPPPPVTVQLMEAPATGEPFESSAVMLRIVPSGCPAIPVWEFPAAMLIVATAGRPVGSSLPPQDVSASETTQTQADKLRIRFPR